MAKTEPPDGDLVVLIGGSRHRFWYSLQDFEHMRRAAGRLHRSDGVMEYLETDRFLKHPFWDVTGRAWRHKSVPERKAAS